MDGLTLAAVLTTAGAAVAGGLVAGIVQLTKPLLPDPWAYGRAPMLLSAALALVIVVLAIGAAGLAIDPNTIFLGLLTWYGVYAAAIGSHATVSKASRVVTGTTNPEGPDAGPS